MRRGLRFLPLALCLCLVGVGMLEVPAAARASRWRAGASVVGGTPTAPGAYPWMAALVEPSHDAFFEDDNPKGFFCGGTLIAPDRVLTAAHCVFGTSPRDTNVIIGDADLEGPTPPPVRVKGVSTYPGYHVPIKRLSGKDVAILQLAAPVGVPPVPLIDPAQAAQLPAGTVVRALGRGSTSPVGPFKVSSRLLETDLSLVADATCQQMFPRKFHLATQLCVGQAPGRGVCYGDSGGPLLVQTDSGWSQLGVASGFLRFIKNPCVTDRQPQIFARLSTLAAFALSPDPTFAPYNLRRPVVHGKLKRGAVLRCSPGRWHGEHRHFRFQWLRGFPAHFQELEIGKRRGSHRHLRVTRALVRSGVQCEVEAANLGGRSFADSHLRTRH